MDIPLKSRPKVSTVDLVDDSKFNLPSDLEAVSKPIATASAIAITRKPRTYLLEPENAINDDENNIIHSNPKKYKLTRTYSESETNNFDEETGHRLFDDGKIRPKMSRTNSSKAEIIELAPKIYSRSHNEYIDHDMGALVGLEDEYIPGLDFSDMVYKWNSNNSDQNIAGLFTDSQATTASNTPLSRDASYLDLNQLHAQVSPQPIKLRNQLQHNRFSVSKLSDYLKMKNQPPAPTALIPERVDSTSTVIEPSSDYPNKHKKLKGSAAMVTSPGNVHYEAILNSLPSNFNELPYSQRKKLVKSFSESIDYSQFSLFAKNYLSEKVSLASSRASKSGSSIGTGNFTRRSRVSSSNTIAGRLLLSSSVDLHKLQDAPPKENVDEKGAMVLGHKLGKIIGFGAWGTIRECVGVNGEIRAIKIVKSTRDFESGSPKKSGGLEALSNSSSSHIHHKHNPKILQVFKKEIQIWKQLHHSNILPLLKYLETEDAIFCITDRIFGGTLFEVVTNWGVYNSGCSNTLGDIQFLMEDQINRLRQTAEFTRQIVDALLYMHEELGIIHGDLKLENVLVDDLDKNNVKMILCDFGMSRVYTTRLSRRSSRSSAPRDRDFGDSELMMRSKSSTADLRKPYKGGDTHRTRFLFTDDSKIGISNYFRAHGPSLQSIDLTPTQSNDSLAFFHEMKTKEKLYVAEGIESNLPHSHIGSLPYASPELLLPSPPPLGPSADIWALGVLMWTMVVGKLPFQHPYEPRLRAMITAGKYNEDDLKKACLLMWIMSEKEESELDPDENAGIVTGKSFLSAAAIDQARDEQIDRLYHSWMRHDKNEFRWMYETISGCLEANITKRWDLEMINGALQKYKSQKLPSH